MTAWPTNLPGGFVDTLAIRGRKPPADPFVDYTGVVCMNPCCGAPMDVFGLWPEMTGNHGTAALLRVIVTLECPSCERRSTYCRKDVSYFQGQSRDDWR